MVIKKIYSAPENHPAVVGKSEPASRPAAQAQEGELLGRRVRNVSSDESSLLGETLCTGLIIFNVVATVIAYVAISYMKQRNLDNTSL